MTKAPSAAKAAEQKSESLEKSGTDAAEVSAAGPGEIYVFANLKQSVSFRLSREEAVTVKGLPVSSLRKPGGGFFAGGGYGVTRVAADQWDRVVKIYGKMKIFQNGLVFAAPSLERGKAMARERGGLRHGYEPVDPASNRARTSPLAEE